MKQDEIATNGISFFKPTCSLIPLVTWDLHVEVRLDRANPFTPVSHALPAQHGWLPSAWPYEARDVTGHIGKLGVVFFPLKADNQRVSMQSFQRI